MMDFENEEITQPIAYETLAQVAQKWREELNHEKLASSDEAPQKLK